MRTHYSEQLGRYYEDDDLLTRHEAAQVLSFNAGREIRESYVSDLAYKKVLPFERISERKLLIQYKYLRNYIVTQIVGRKVGASPSANAERQRKFKARRRAAGASGDDQERVAVAV